MAQAVVAAVAAARLQPELSEGQCHVVADDEQSRLVYPLLVEPIAHGVAREVHECGGL